MFKGTKFELSKGPTCKIIKDVGRGPTKSKIEFLTSYPVIFAAWEGWLPGKCPAPTVESDPHTLP